MIWYTLESNFPVFPVLPQRLLQASREAGGASPVAFLACWCRHHDLLDVVLVVGARWDGRCQGSAGMAAIKNGKDVARRFDDGVGDVGPMHALAIATGPVCQWIQALSWEAV